MSFLPVIAALALPLCCFADVSPHATVAGEVDSPGRFVVTKAATLSAVFSEIAKPLAMGATSRVRVYRNGTRRDYDLKRFGDVGVVGGDIAHFASFRAAVDHYLDNLNKDHQPQLESLLTLKFQTF